MSCEPVPFEGVEKRLVIQFSPEAFSQNDLKSPYDMSAADWQPILDYAQCQIISEKLLGEQKVYLLSESTLMVWRSGFLMKTCGRTTPFLALQRILERFGSILGNTKNPMEWVNWMTYSRLDFLHPDYQTWPHQNFEQETEFIQQYFPEIETGQMPAGENTLYVMFATNGERCDRPYAMEECLMTGVDERCVRSFTGYDNASEQKLFDHGSNESSVMRTCIADKEAVLDEFWFDPCGYSSNALLNVAGAQDYFSCHVSPEPVTSFASLEIGSTAAVTSFKREGCLQFTSMIPAFSAQNVSIARIVVRPADNGAEPQECLVDSAEAIASIKAVSAPDAFYDCRGAQSLRFSTANIVCSVEHIALCCEPNSRTPSSAGDYATQIMGEDCPATLLSC